MQKGALAWPRVSFILSSRWGRNGALRAATRAGGPDAGGGGCRWRPGLGLGPRRSCPPWCGARPPPHFATSAAAAAAGLSGDTGSRAVGSGKRPAPRRAEVPGRFYKPEGGGAPVGVGQSAVGGGAAETERLSRLLRDQCLGRLGSANPPEDSSRNVPTPSWPERTPSQAAVPGSAPPPVLCQRSVRGRRGLQCLPGLPHLSQVAKADLSAGTPPSPSTDARARNRSSSWSSFVTLASVIHLTLRNLSRPLSRCIDEPEHLSLSASGL